MPRTEPPAPPANNGAAMDVVNGLLGEGGVQSEDEAKILAEGQARAGGSKVKDRVYVPWVGAHLPRARHLRTFEDEPKVTFKRRDPNLPASYQNPEADPSKPDPRPEMPDEPSLSPWQENPANYQNPEAAPVDQVPDDPDARDLVREMDDVLLDPHRWDTEEYADITRQMANVGLIDAENFNLTDVLQAWEKLVVLAAQRHQARPDELLTPLDMLDIAFGNGENTDGAEKKIDPVEVLQKSTTISSNTQARNMLRAMLADKLGRRPTPIEVDDFQAALNDAQRANPTITKGTTYFEKGKASHTDQTTYGGLDSAEFADEYTDWRDPDSEYGRYQAATTYYNALMGAIRGPGGA